jgi:serine protease Do
MNNKATKTIGHSFTTAITAFLIGALLTATVFLGVSCDPADGTSAITTEAPLGAPSSEDRDNTADVITDPDTSDENLLPINRDNATAKTPSAIYEENVGSVVGILSVGKTTNIFGQTTATASAGTGFVIREDGYIMTNYHVVEKGGDLTVSFADGSTYKAELVGYESDFSDIAVLKIEAEGLVPVTLGSTHDRKVGEDVVVIGNPLGELTFSLSRGVISALERRINTDGTPISMLQIDAAVNSGNSGGPAFGPDGKVIGVVTAKYASESIEGLGFCIPAEDAAEIASDLITYGYVKGRASLGVACDDAYEVYAYYYRYYGKRVDSMGLLKEGVYIGEVLLDSPAAEAGLQKADYIVAVNGKAVADCAALSNALADAKPGDTWTLTVSHNGEMSEITLTLDEYNPLSYGALSSGSVM